MKTKQMIDGLDVLRLHPERAKDYDCFLRKVKERLMELSSGETSTDAEQSKRNFTIHELAIMNDQLKQRIRELENKKGLIK